MVRLHLIKLRTFLLDLGFQLLLVLVEVVHDRTQLLVRFYHPEQSALGIRKFCWIAARTFHHRLDMLLQILAISLIHLLLGIESFCLVKDLGKLGARFVEFGVGFRERFVSLSELVRFRFFASNLCALAFQIFLQLLIFGWYRTGRSIEAAYVVSLVSILLQEVQSFSIHFQGGNPILAQGFDVIKSFRESSAPTVSKNTIKGTITYFEASKISSNFFFNAAGSESGQFDSS